MAEIGMTATASAQAIAGLLSFERALLVAIADRIARVPSLPAKMLLCRAVWTTACRIRALCRVLPADLTSVALDSFPDDHTERLVAVLAGMSSEQGFLAGLCRIVAPFAASAYRAIRLPSDDAVARDVRRAAWEHRQTAAKRCRWLDRHACSHDDERRLRALAHMTAYDEIGLGARIPAVGVDRTSAELSRPEREQAIRALRYGEASEEVWFVSCAAEYRAYLHQLIAFEINTFEAVSRHIAEFAWMPWEFHWDMASQIRDELSHLEMWLERLPHAGGRLGEHPLSMHELAVCAGHELPGRIALLERLIESTALDSLDLNRVLWETRGDGIMLGYLQRVQIDEIGHVRQGNKWLRRLVGEDEQILDLVAGAEATSRRRMLGAARALEEAGIVSHGNVERVRRKFDDALALEVNRSVRTQAGFSDAEIAHEIERRRRALVVAPASAEEIPRRRSNDDRDP
jgi:uncharacterized ferritin-like protein (DUF455 family)